MALEFLKIQIPAGVVDHGTDLDSKGRWIDSQYVRWTNGKPHPIGGWDSFAENAGAELITDGDLEWYAIGNSSPPPDWVLESGALWLLGIGAYFNGGSSGTVGATIYQDIEASLTVGSKYLVTAEIGILPGANGATVSLLLNNYESPEFTVISGNQTITHVFTLESKDLLPKTGIRLKSKTDSADTSRIRTIIFSVKELVSTSIDTATDGFVRGSHAWFDNTDAPFLGFGTYNTLQAIDGNGVVYDIAPSDLTVGIPESAQNLGYGGGPYGRGSYGTPRIGNYTIAPATNWTIDNWGENLIACSDADGRVLEWDVSAFRSDGTTKAAAISGAPTGCRSIVVTQERFVFALGAGGNPRQIQWSDREDNTIWTPAVTNEAGDFELTTDGEIVCAERVRGRTLILTTQDAYIATYLGPPLVYGFQKVGGSCGCVARNTSVAVGQLAFWMGENNFYFYDGSQAQALPCEVHDRVFQNIRRSRRSHAFAVANEQFNEVWWFYPAQGDNENTLYVAYDYQDNHWMVGELGRSSGVGFSVFDNPVMFGADGKVYRHEVSFAHDVAPFLETAPINLNEGDKVFHVLQALTNTEGMNGQESLQFYKRYYDDDAWEEASGSLTVANNPVDVRFSGRQMKYKVTLPDGVDWRWGDLRIRFKQAGRR